MSLQKSSFKEHGKSHGADTTLDAGISNKSTAAGETSLNQNMPHYQLPNITKLLYDYTNKQADLIQRCFQTGNYNSIRDLPDQLTPAQVINAQRNKQASNVTIKAQPKLIQLISGGGVFSDFEWMPDDYDNCRWVQKKLTQDRIDHQERMKKIGGTQPWKVGFDSKIEKFKDPFGASGYIFPFFNVDDPFQATHDQVMRAKWMKQSKILHGEFKPSLGDKSLDKVCKSQLPDIVNFIKKTLLQDWSDTNFLIGTNPDDFIEIKFEQTSQDSISGLHAYMNTLVSNHEIISQFNLKKIVQFWGHKLGNYIYFMLSPPWVRTKISDTYYSLYPERQPRFAPTLDKLSSTLHSPAKKAQLFSQEINIQ